MDTNVLVVDKPAQHVARLRINRPEKRNAIDHGVREALMQALTALQRDPSVRSLVLGGIGGIFSAGGDLPSMAGLDEAGARARMRHIHEVCRLVSHLRVPVVSACEGITAGAAVGLALLGDHIVAGEGTRFLFPFLKLGLVPDWGQLRTLPSRVGTARAKQLLWRGQPLQGGDAYTIGLADTLVPDDQVMGAAIEQAVSYAQLPAEAFVRMKSRLLQPAASLPEDLAREAEDQAVCLQGDDFREGLSAFMDKREADFIRQPGAR